MKDANGDHTPAFFFFAKPADPVFYFFRVFLSDSTFVMFSGRRDHNCKTNNFVFQDHNGELFFFLSKVF